MRDTALVSIIAGGLGGLVYQVFVWLSSIMGYAKITPFQVGAAMLVNSNVEYTSLAAQMLGMVQHFSTSVLLSFLAIYIVQAVGKDHLLIKGISYGSILYFIIYGVIGRFIIPVSTLQPDLVTSAVYLFGNLLFGITVFYMIGRLLQDPVKKR